MIEEAAGDFKKGDQVSVTGCGTSETMWGGYSEYARIDPQFIVPLPAGMSLQQAMGIGTAGFTSMQSVMALEQHGLKPGGKDVLVTGAAGGVGSVAIAILAKLGYKVAGSTGRPEQHEYLRKLGASDIIDRATLSTASKRPLEAERWAAAIDNVGGDTLGSVLKAVALGGSVASCGLAGGPSLNTTVFPFILRGVNLLGIDSTRVPNAQRREIWARIMRDLPMSTIDEVITIQPLSKIFELGGQILAGQVRGRTVIDVSA